MTALLPFQYAYDIKTKIYLFYDITIYLTLQSFIQEYVEKGTFRRYNYINSV